MNKLKRNFLYATIALASSSLSAADSYDVIDLGELDENSVFAFGVNESNVAVGYSYRIVQTTQGPADDIVHAVAYQNDALVDLGAIDNSILNPNTSLSRSLAFDLNDNNLVVGFSNAEYLLVDENGDPVLDINGNEQFGNYERAIYSTIGSNTTLSVPELAPGDNRDMRAQGVNNSGIIVGHGEFNPDDDLDLNGNVADLLLERPFIYDSVADTLTRLDPLNYDGSILRAVLRDVNDNGIAVGWSDELHDSSVYVKSYFVDVTDPQNLTKLPITDDKRNNTAFAINNNGKIVGKYEGEVEDCNLGFFCSLAYIYDTQAQVLTDIPVLTEGLVPENTLEKSAALDINDLDQVVGRVIYSVVPNTYHAFIFENGETKDLNTLIDCKVDPAEEAIGEPDWVLYEATAINNSGVIVGNGILNGERHAFMLMPRTGDAEACQPDPDKASSSGSGSLLWSVLFLGLLGLRKKQS